MTSMPVRLTVAPLGVEDIAAIARRRARVEVAPEIHERVRSCRAVVDRHAAENRPIYGLTTALGAAVDTPLSEEDLIAYQRRISYGHAVGFGPALSREAVRAMMAVRMVPAYRRRCSKAWLPPSMPACTRWCLRSALWAQPIWRRLPI
jgi:histidine ammonia-lyase